MFLAKKNNGFFSFSLFCGIDSFKKIYEKTMCFFFVKPFAGRPVRLSSGRLRDRKGFQGRGNKKT